MLDRVAYTGLMYDKFFQEISLFDGLEQAALTEVQFVSAPFRFQAGDPIFSQGDEADGMYLLKTGTVSVTRRLPGDESMELAQLSRGSVIGEMGLLDRGRRSATATAVEECSGYFVSFSRFEHLRLNFTPAAFGIIQCFVTEVIHRLRGLLCEIGELIDESPEMAPGIRVGTGNASEKGERKSGKLPRWDVLERVPFLRRLSRNELRSFVDSLEVLSVDRGSVIIDQGEQAETCYILVRGAVALDMIRNDRYVQIAMLGPGSIFGEIALIDGGLQPFECRAREESILVAMNRARIDELRKSGTPAAFKFFEAVTGDSVGLLRKANGHIAWMKPEKQFRAELSSASHAPVEAYR